MFQETGPNSWVGTKIRRGNKLGTVVCDINGAWRILTIRFDGSEETIKMNNIGRDPKYIHEYEWLTHDNKWYRF